MFTVQTKKNNFIALFQRANQSSSMIITITKNGGVYLKNINVLKT